MSTVFGDAANNSRYSIRLLLFVTNYATNPATAVMDGTHVRAANEYQEKSKHIESDLSTKNSKRKNQQYRLLIIWLLLARKDVCRDALNT